MPRFLLPPRSVAGGRWVPILWTTSTAVFDSQRLRSVDTLPPHGKPAIAGIETTELCAVYYGYRRLQRPWTRKEHKNLSDYRDEQSAAQFLLQACRECHTSV